jgi:predicted deacylase
VGDVLRIAGVDIGPGRGAIVRIPLSRGYAHREFEIPVHVVRGTRPGPRLFLSAAIHGDEINGIEIIRRVLRSPRLIGMRGTLLAVPVVNVFGFVTGSRYLPDRRDLNRSFPGSARGSGASRLAHRFLAEIVDNATHGIDLHTGAQHRSNLPQVRACLDDPETARLARAFGAPVILDSRLRDGSLRQAVFERGIPVLLFEAGEALRFDELAIRAGVQGVLSVMGSIGMLRRRSRRRAVAEPFVARSSAWIRAGEGGLLRSELRLGARVERGDTVGRISGPLGEGEVPVRSEISGVAIGRTRLPLVNAGDALFHVATFDRLDDAAAEVEAYHEALAPDHPETD